MTTVLAVSVVVLALALLGAAYVAHPAPAAFGSAVNPPSAWLKDAPPEFVIGTFNIHGGRGLDGIRDLQRCAVELRNADIAALQEVHADTWFGRPCQADSIAASLNIGWLFAPTRRRWFRDYRGNALLTRFPVTEWQSEPLVDISGHSFRILTVARLQVGGRELWVLFTHLHPRLATAQQLRTVISRFRNYNPAVLIGDLNTTRGDQQLRALLAEDGVTDALGSALGDKDRADRIDWIITRGLEINGGGWIAAGASDHPYYWVQAGIRMTSQPGGADDFE